MEVLEVYDGTAILSLRRMYKMGSRAYKFEPHQAPADAARYVPSMLDKVTIPCRIAIFENTYEWMIVAMGAFTQRRFYGMTVYAVALSTDAVVEAVADTMLNSSHGTAVEVGTRSGSTPPTQDGLPSSDLQNRVSMLICRLRSESGLRGLCRFRRHRLPPTPPGIPSCVQF
jgi:hypothetical protein